LALYLKLNVLLAAALLLWWLTKGLARGFGFESSHARQLKVARFLFTGLLGAAVLALFAYGWLTALATTLVDGVTVVAAIDTGLERNYAVGAVGFELQYVLLAVLFSGFAWQAARLVRQVRKLRAIVDGAAEWRCIRGTYLLVSPDIQTPFSTRALGSKHVVLPMTLLESPRNLRLAVKHELQHVRNGDLEWVILLEAVKLLCFWNPAAWLWHNEFDCLQEFACDEALINRRHVTPQAYGTCLLEVASANSGNALLAASNMVPKFSWLQDTQSQLKRRITMLTTVRGTKNQIAKSLGYALLAGAGMTQTALVVFAADGGPPVDAVPIVRINPDYPAQALSTGRQAWVQLQFTITETGAVLDPLVVDNCVWLSTQDAEDCKPDDMFNTSALAAVSKWRYSPSMENGTAVAREGVHTMIRYILEEPSDEAKAALIAEVPACADEQSEECRQFFLDREAANQER
jgi:TonB family protein